jgi:hypothetical protein
MPSCWFWTGFHKKSRLTYPPSKILRIFLARSKKNVLGSSFPHSWWRGLNSSKWVRKIFSRKTGARNYQHM